MQSYVAIVKDTTNIHKTGSFWAQVPDLSKEELRQITYTSPYYRVNTGGMVAIQKKSLKY